jgi:hypothetical protein
MDHGGWTGVRVKERRRGPDGWIRVLQGLVILCWGGFVALLSSITSPGQSGLRLSGLWGRQGAPELGPPAHPGWSAGLGLLPADPGGAGAGRGRSRRQEDARHVNLFILLLILVACLLLYYRG